MKTLANPERITSGTVAFRDDIIVEGGFDTVGDGTGGVRFDTVFGR